MVNRLLFAVALVVLFVACSNDDDSIDLSDERLAEGYIVTGFTADNTVLARYFEELPSGTIDLTQGQAFQRFFPFDVYDGAVYIQNPVANGFSKMVVNGNGEIIQEGTIPTTGKDAFMVRIRDSNTGVFVDPNDFSEVNIFNPQTLQLRGSIDLSAAPIFTNPPPVLGLGSMVVRDDDVFLVMSGGNGPLLDNYTMVRGSISSGTLGNQLNATTGPTFTFNPVYRLTNEQGDLYIHHQGNLSPAPLSNTGGVLRIPTGSNEFDPNYDFRVTLDPTLILQSMRAFAYYQQGIAYAHIGLETPPEVVDILVSVGGAIQNLTEAQRDQILVLLNTSENGGWVEWISMRRQFGNYPGSHDCLRLRRPTLTLSMVFPIFQ